MKDSLFILLIIIVCIFIIRMYMSRQSTKIDLSGLEILNHLKKDHRMKGYYTLEILQNIRKYLMQIKKIENIHKYSKRLRGYKKNTE